MIPRVGDKLVGTDHAHAGVLGIDPGMRAVVVDVSTEGCVRLTLHVPALDMTITGVGWPTSALALDVLRGSQIAPASDAGRDIAALVESLRDIEDRLVRAGLWEDFNKLQYARAVLGNVGLGLEQKAREAYLAARRGMELPK